MNKNTPLHLLNFSVFFQTQLFLLPVLFLFYQSNGLSVSDFFLFQGVFSLAGLLFEIPAGYLGDVFSKKSVLILSYSCFVMRLLLWLFFAKYGYWILLCGEILYAAQKATFSGASDSYIYEYLAFQKMPGKMLKKYGKMNFFLSIGSACASLFGAWIYHLVSEWSVARYQHDYGFVVLIVMELVLNLIAIGFLCLLPKVPQLPRPKKTLRQVYHHFFQIITTTFQNRAIRYHILYSGLLAGVTLIFVWGFQPLMKLLTIPVSVYGVIYFINHAFRAFSSLCADKIKRAVSLSNLAVIAFLLFTASFILTFIVMNVQPLPLWLNLCYFTFVCLTIGIQMSFYLAHVGRLHKLVSASVRTTISSINTAVGRSWAGFFFILLKILMDGFPTQVTFTVCFGIFLIASIPLKWVYQISADEEKES